VQDGHRTVQGSQLSGEALHMGNVTGGPPHSVVERLAYQFGIQTFFETGTYRGDTAQWASQRFAHVITIERSETVHAAVAPQLAQVPNVTSYLADSRVVLRDRIRELAPTIFWLDAHWCGGETAGIEDECPLLGEINLIAPYSDRHFIMIDDARLFIAPPPLPHKAEQWPTLDEILGVWASNTRPQMLIFHDVILLSPQWARRTVADLVRDFLKQPPN
jgi:hypothetical protein